MCTIILIFYCTQAEKDVTEFSIQIEGLSERLDEADGLNAAQADISRKRETELTKLRKDIELINVQHESAEASLRKRHQDAVNDLSDQIEHLGRGKSKWVQIMCNYYSDFCIYYW